MLHKILYNLFDIITIVNASGRRLSKGEKAKVRSFVTGPAVYVSLDNPIELRVLDYHGQYAYNVTLD